MKLQPGTLLQGDRYRIIDILGQGGFGITYLAEQIMAERKVCIKEFFPKEYYNRDEDSRSISLGTQGSAETMELYKAKFVKEAKTIAKLDHPNIIHIFDVFSENNTAYYVMEYIEGESLSDVVKRNGGALAESVAVDYIKQTASALGYIHERNIMHLDVKPANIMLRKADGKPVLIDFGLSKQYDAEGNQTSSTPVGISAGFAPMEQYQQGGVKEFSPETDIYSLGATLYYLVTGCVPPQAAAIVDDGLPELPAHLSQGVRRAIERSMEITRKRRPHSMSEFVALLGDGNTATIPTPTPTPVAVPTPSFADEATVIGTQTSTLDEKTVITTTPKVEAPKKELTPKYSTEKPKKSEERTKKKSRWWLWLLGLLLIGGGAYFLLVANNGKNTENTKNIEEDKIAAQTVAILERWYVGAREKDWVGYWVAEGELNCIDHTLKSGSDARKAFEKAMERWQAENSDKMQVIANFWQETDYNSNMYLIRDFLHAVQSNNDDEIKRLLHPDCYHDIEKLKLQCSMLGLGNSQLVGSYRYDKDSVEEYIIAAEVDENINVRDFFNEHERAEEYISPSGHVFLYENLSVVDYNGEKRIWTNADMLDMEYAERRLSWSSKSIPSCYYQGNYFGDK